jgi:Endonuclease-reverse transcriptase
LKARSPIWGSERTCSTGKIIENLPENQDQSTINAEEVTHVTPSSGSTSAIDITIVSPELLPELTWHVLQELCGSDHFSTITTICGIQHEQNFEKQSKTNYLTLISILTQLKLPK